MNTILFLFLFLYIFHIFPPFFTVYSNEHCFFIFIFIFLFLPEIPLGISGLHFIWTNCCIDVAHIFKVLDIILHNFIQRICFFLATVLL